MSDPRAPSEGLSPGEKKQVAQIRRGSASAFETLFRAHESLVHNICLSLTGASDVASDLVQDLFCDLWDRRHDLNPTVSLKAYLAGAARNKALNWIRRNRRTRDAFREAPDAESLSAWDKTGETEPTKGALYPRSQETPRDALQHKDLQEALKQAVQALPDRRRLVYKMAREEHLSYAEIATALGISVNTVKTQMGRTLKFLRQRLKIYDFASKKN